jgi:Chromo (CHRromatin Organisation MOdifier) domain
MGDMPLPLCLLLFRSVPLFPLSLSLLGICRVHSIVLNLIFYPLSNVKRLMQVSIGESILFRLEFQLLLPLRRNQLPRGYSSKLTAKFMGPFPIVAAIGNIAFKLDLRATISIHPVFHVSQLKPCEPSNTSTGITNPGRIYADKRGEFYEVEKIVAKKRAGRSWKFLVKWKGWEHFNKSWEPLANVRHLSDLIAAAPEVS